MQIALQKDWFKNLYDFLSKRVAYHSILWSVYIVIMLLFNYSGLENLPLTFANVLIHSIFLGALVYLNILYLIPQYLSKKKLVTYFILLAFATIIATPLELICLYWNMSHYTEAQRYLIQNQYVHFLFMFLVLNGSTILKIGKEWLLQERIKRDLERRNLQSELSFLKSQINPHFLFNTLNSLYALTLKKSDKAPEIVLRLSEMMRYMLYESNEKKVSLEKEVKYIQNYLELERIRYGDKAEILFEYSGDAPDSYDITPLLFIPFLENAFKHGLSNSISQGYVHVSMIVAEGEIQFDIMNSKSDEPKDEHYYQGGIGLKNVKRRLELIYNNYYDLKIKDSTDSYAVSLNIDTKPKHPKTLSS